MFLKEYIHYRVRRFRHVIKDRFPVFYRFMSTREAVVFVVLFSLLFIVLVGLFHIQIIQGSSYQSLLAQNHSLSKTTSAQRWNVYVSDTSQVQPLKLTENVTLYNMFVDPSLVYDKKRLINIISPLLYVHFCQINGFDVIDQDKERCVRNIEVFTRQTILPKAPETAYYGNWVASWEYVQYSGDQFIDMFDWQEFESNQQEILSGLSQNSIIKLIEQRLDSMITIGDKKYNYLWYYLDTRLISDLRALNRDYIYIHENRYIFIEPQLRKDTWPSRSKAAQEIKDVLSRNGYIQDALRVDDLFEVRSYRYVKLASGINPRIIDGLRSLENEYYSERGGPFNTPLLYGIWTESYVERYYPYGDFMSHILWYIASDGKPTYGVEEYFDDVLRGKDWSVQWISSRIIGELGANNINITQVENGYDVYLTIDPVIQNQAEQLVSQRRAEFFADSVSVLVYDPYSWHVLASANAPSFDPNRYGDGYTLKALGPEQADYVDDITYMDFPIYIRDTDGSLRTATISERQDSSLKKYVMRQPLGPNLFVDKNIAYPYEPWSIFKVFTYAIGLDQREIEPYDYYEDPKWEAKVWPYTIKNADQGNCIGTHSFLHALQYSCNVGMVRIAQRLTENTFYNYLEKLWFGKYTGIELAWEDPWYVEWVGSVSMARFFNNVFWQGLLATPIQIVSALWAIINDGSYVKPTILDRICESGTEKCQDNDVKVVRQIFEPRIAQEMLDALRSTIEIPSNGRYASSAHYKFWGKSWTSQISYQGRYMGWNWWTNGSFLGVISVDNPKYIVMVEIRRPRSSQWWISTAWTIFRDMGEFLINYESLKGERFEQK